MSNILLLKRKQSVLCISGLGLNIVKSIEKLNVVFVRVCGNSGGGVFTKKLLGPSNMMIIRFDSETYSTVAPGTGFTFTVEAAPSGL